MSERIPDHTTRIAAPSISIWKKVVLSVRAACGTWARFRQLCVWFALAVLVTTGLGAAANHLAQNSSVESASEKLKNKKPKRLSQWISAAAPWWNPATAPTSDAPPATPQAQATSDSNSGQTSSVSSPAIAFRGGSSNSSGATLNNSLVPIGSNASRTGATASSWNLPVFGTNPAPRIGLSANPGTKGKHGGKSAQPLPLPTNLAKQGAGTLQLNASNATISGVSVNRASNVSGSIIPVDRGIQFSGGTLVTNSGLPTGTSTVVQEPYQVLGLSKSSFPQATAASVALTASSTPSVVSFSLVGDVNLIPSGNTVAVYAGANLEALPVPEPSVWAMLGMAGTVMVSRCRRKFAASLRFG